VGWFDGAGPDGRRVAAGCGTTRSVGWQRRPTRCSNLAAGATPARDRTVHCSIGVNAYGVKADEQFAGHSASRERAGSPQHDCRRLSGPTPGSRMQGEKEGGTHDSFGVRSGGQLPLCPLSLRALASW